MTFLKLLEHLNNLEERIIVKNLNDVSIHEISPDMERIERGNFNPFYANNARDIEDDTEQRGFVGFGLFDDNDNKIKGYVYGYGITEDEYEDIDDITPDQFREYVKLYDQRYSNITPENFKETFTPQNTIYVSNMVVDKPFRMYLLPLLREFFNTLRQRNVKYIQFDALKDTENLLFNPDGTPKQERMRKYNFNVIASMKTDDDSSMSIIEL
jgi:hypothetical protein